MRVELRQRGRVERESTFCVGLRGPCHGARGCVRDPVPGDALLERITRRSMSRRYSRATVGARFGELYVHHLSHNSPTVPKVGDVGESATCATSSASPRSARSRSPRTVRVTYAGLPEAASRPACTRNSHDPGRRWRSEPRTPSVPQPHRHHHRCNPTTRGTTGVVGAVWAAAPRLSDGRQRSSGLPGLSWRPRQGSNLRPAV